MLWLVGRKSLLKSHPEEFRRGSPGSFFSFQGTDPISQTKVAELLGEGDSGRAPHEGLGGSVKFEGGDDASVAVEWSGVSLIIAP